MHLYPSFVRFLDDYTGGAYGELLAGFEAAFVPQYKRLAGFARDEAARAGVGAPELPGYSESPAARRAPRRDRPAVTPAAR